MEKNDCTKLLIEYITEIVAVAEPNNNYFTIKSEEGKNFVLKANGGHPWIKGLSQDLKCFSVYKMIKFIDDKVDPVQIIKSLKNPGLKDSLRVSKGTMNQILQKGVEVSTPWFAGMNIEVVTTPQSSKTLSVKFAKSIAEKIGAKFVPAGTIKDLESAKISDNLPITYSTKTISGLNKSLTRMKSSKDKDLHKHFLPRDRKFITNWQKLRKEDEFLNGMNVLLVDDVISDGATLFEMSNILKKSKVNIVGCITLFKTGD